MKILLLNNEFPPIGGGGSVLNKFVAKNLVDLGNEVKLVTSGYDKLPSRETMDGFDIHRVRAIRKRHDYSNMFELIVWSFSSFIYCIKLFKKWKPDIIQAYFAVPAGGVAWALHKSYKIPYCVYLGGSDVPGANPVRFKKVYPIITPLIKLFWSEAEVVTAASERLVKLGKKADPGKKFTIIPNGVDTKLMVPNKTKRGNIVKIIAVGRLMPQKGFNYAIEALPQVVKGAKKPFKLVIVGSGNEMDNLQELAKHLKVEKYVEFTGSVNYKKLKSLYQSSDIIIQPSLAEGMPLSLLEGMSTGMPAISTKVSGNEEIAIPGKNGFLAEPADPKGLADAMIQLINNKTLRMKMGKESKKVALQYDWATLTQKYNDIYNTIYSSQKVKC